MNSGRERWRVFRRHRLKKAISLLRKANGGEFFAASGLTEPLFGVRKVISLLRAEFRLFFAARKFAANVFDKRYVDFVARNWSSLRALPKKERFSAAQGFV